MSKAPAFQTYAADYYMDTAHWTVEEVGIYQRLLLFEWVNGPLPNDEKRLARIAGCSTKKFQKGWTTISIKFIPFGTCQLQNKRLEQTRENQHKYSESRKENINKRWNKNDTHVDTHVKDMKNIDDTLQSSSSSSTSKKNKNISLSFEEFYKAYPKHEAKQAALKAWKKIDLNNGTLELILEAIKKQKVHKETLKAKGEFVPEWPLPASWLNGRRWEDEIQETPSDKQVKGKVHVVDRDGKQRDPVTGEVIETFEHPPDQEGMAAIAGIVGDLSKKMEGKP